MTRIDLIAGAVSRLRVAIAHVPLHRRQRDKPERDLDLLDMTLKQLQEQLAALQPKAEAEPEPQSWSTPEDAPRHEPLRWSPACHVPVTP